MESEALRSINDRLGALIFLLGRVVLTFTVPSRRPRLIQKLRAGRPVDPLGIDYVLDYYEYNLAEQKAMEDLDV